MNPNAAPSQFGGGAPAGTNAADALNIPSILLMVCGGLGILFGLLGMIGGGGASALGPLANDPKFAQLMAMQTGPLHYVTGLLGIGISGLTIFGALKMRGLESYGLAMASAIAALIPCGGCCCIPLPLGIWALVLLIKPEIKSQFRG